MSPNSGIVAKYELYPGCFHEYMLECLSQWSRLEVKLNAFCRSTIPQKQFLIIITVIIIKFKVDDVGSNK